MEAVLSAEPSSASLWEDHILAQARRASRQEVTDALTAQLLHERRFRELIFAPPSPHDREAWHEMRNRILALSLHLRALSLLLRAQNSAPSEEIEPLIRDMEQEIHQAQQTLHSSRTESETLEQAPTSTTILGPCIEEAQRTFAQHFPQIPLKVSITPEAAQQRVAVCMGASGLCKVLRLLLDNAAEGVNHEGVDREEVNPKGVNPKGVNPKERASRVHLHVGIEATGDMAFIVLEDDGPGFPSNVLERIEPFFSTKPQRPGLGLFICERLLMASDGDLLCSNVAPQGARVRILLPVR